MAPQGTLLIFLKYPEPGKVKTRLARTIGSTQAASLYRSWIGTVLDALQGLRQTIRMTCLFDGGALESFREWHRLADVWWPQSTGDLGDRLLAGFISAFELGGPVVAIGTDCLEIDTALVLLAFEKLANHEVVFGPTPDGGYYLVGTAELRPRLFQSIRWSSRFTLSDHILRCREEDWSVRMLPMRHDIDTSEEWRDYLLRSERPKAENANDSGRRSAHSE